MTGATAPGGAPRVCRVRPDLAAVQRAFDYLVPDSLRSEVRVGAVVRVPLHGRRVRGWVVADGVEPEAPPERLVPLHAIVSAGPPPAVVALCEWAAWRWAGPVSAFLRAASPPNVVDPAPPADAGEPESAWYPAPPPPAALGASWPADPVRVVTWPPGLARGDLVRSLLAAEGSSLVLVPEPARAGALVRAIERDGRAVLHHHGDLADRDRTAVWRAARRGAAVVVGGRAAVWLPLPDLASVVVLDERDEAFQDERAPTWHARDVAVERARRTRAVVTLVSPAPSLEARVTPGAVLVAPRPRDLRAAWPHLDTVDLRGEPPGARVCSEALGPAIRRAIDAGGRAVCVVNRRGRARLLACRACQSLARCARCGATVSQPADRFECARCGESRPPVCAECGATSFRVLRPGVHAVRDEVAGLVPRVEVVDVDVATDPVDAGVAAAPVLVGTEAVLHRLVRARDRPVRLVAFLTFDEELMATRFRAHEQALWLLVRAARLLGPRSEGGRLLVQTRAPGHAVLRVAASGDPEPFAREEAVVRSELHYPPFGGLAEVSGAPAAVAAATAAVRDAGLTVLGGRAGPALVRAASVTDLADGLARVDLAPARARGRLRVSVDPPRA